MAKKKNKLVLLCGLPASGKSTWAKQQISEDKSFVRINRDDLRAMLANMHFSNRNEKLVSKIRDHAIIEAIAAERNIIVDETGLNPAVRNQMKRIAEKHDYDFELKHFDKHVEECILHDAARSNPVGSKAILHMYRKYVEPNEKKVEYDINKQDAIISDIDGTVAVCGDRNPYDTASADKDGLYSDVADAIQQSLRSTRKLLFVTGREEKFRELTTKWLNQYFDNYELYMRPSSDKRKDYIVKEEILINQILPKYNIFLAYDDRPRCSRVYRKYGITTMHVGINAEW